MLTFRLFGTTVKVKAVVLVDILALWALVSWLSLRWHPGRAPWQALLIGLGAVLVMLPADFGHAVAHIFSARHAGAPMDEIFISEGMPRTLYWHNDVSPAAHRMRAIGGPIFSLCCLLLSLAVFLAAPAASLVRELAAWSAAAHGMLLGGSLLPLPIVDGGSLLKWTLVAGGRDPAQADALIRRIDWGLGGVSVVVGVALLALQSWIAGAVVTVIGVTILAVAMGKLK